MRNRFCEVRAVEDKTCGVPGGGLMANVPKRQRYTPRFYLENFTDSGGLLHIVPRNTGRRWTSRAANTRLERDFYTLEDVSATPRATTRHFFDPLTRTIEGPRGAIRGWPRTGACSGAEAAAVARAFRRAPERAVRGQDPPRRLSICAFLRRVGWPGEQHEFVLQA